jgi:hypothetical protein
MSSCTADQVLIQAVSFQDTIPQLYQHDNYHYLNQSNQIRTTFPSVRYSVCSPPCFRGGRSSTNKSLDSIVIRLDDRRRRRLIGGKDNPRARAKDKDKEQNLNGRRRAAASACRASPICRVEEKFEASFSESSVMDRLVV